MIKTKKINRIKYIYIYISLTIIYGLINELFKFGTLLYIIEEVKLSIVMLVLYKFMLGIYIFFLRKDSIKFLYFTLPIWYRVVKLSIEIVLFLCLTMALFSFLVHESDLSCCNLLAKLSVSPIYCKVHELHGMV